MRKILDRLEHGFNIGSLLYYTGTLNFFGGVAAADNPALQEAASGSPILSLMQYGILAITLLLLLIRCDRTIYLATRRRFLWALVFLVLISFLWSPVPDLTQKRAIIFVGVCLFGLNLSARYTLKEQLYLFAWTAGLIAIINLLFTVALPWAAIEAGEHAGAWRGVYSQKNVSGRMFVLCSSLLLLATIKPSRYRRIFALLLGLTVLLTILSASKGALAILLMLFCVVPLFRVLRSRNSLVVLGVAVLFLTLSSLAVLAVGNLATIAQVIGRDLTFTGRTGIWSVVLSKIALHPWLGYGYRGFWRGMEGDSADVWYETFFMAPNAHNGFLDITIQLGLIGLFILLCSYIKNYGRALIWLRLNQEAEGMLPVMYLTFLLLYNLLETTLFEPAHWVMVIYISITTTVLTEPITVFEPDSENTINSFGSLRDA